MKTSNKLLISLGLGILLSIGLIQLVLYSNFKQGRIVSAGDLHTEKYERYDLPVPSYLSFNGVMWVNIIPSDTFYIELSKENKLIGALSYRQSGDTLLISGNNQTLIHRPYADRFYRANQAQVNVYCHDLKGISFYKGQLYLHGAAGRPLVPSARLLIDSSTLWIGDYTEYKEQSGPKEFFDSLDIRSINSVVLLNTAANIHKLQARLDDHSELNDRQALTDSLAVSYSNDSRVGLTGANLKKAQLTAH